MRRWRLIGEHEPGLRWWDRRAPVASRPVCSLGFGRMGNINGRRSRANECVATVAVAEGYYCFRLNRIGEQLKQVRIGAGERPTGSGEVCDAIREHERGWLLHLAEVLAIIQVVTESEGERSQCDEGNDRKRGVALLGRRHGAAL